MAKPKIHGKAFLEWLKSFEIVPGNTYRVVIEASYDSLVIIYAEMYGTKAMIEVEPPPELTMAIKVTQPCEPGVPPVRKLKREDQPSPEWLAEFEARQQASIKKWEHPND